MIFYDPATEVRAEVTQAIADQREMTIISPFDDHEIMAGAGTTGLEMAEQLFAAGQKPDAVVVNCSGGGLASGVIHFFPEVEKYIVEPQGYAERRSRSRPAKSATTRRSVTRSWTASADRPLESSPLEVLLRHGVKGLTVDDDEALAAVATAYYTLKTVIEPGGAASLAAVLSKKAIFAGKTLAIVASGGNVDPAIYTRALIENPLMRT